MLNPIRIIVEQEQKYGTALSVHTTTRKKNRPAKRQTQRMSFRVTETERNTLLSFFRFSENV